MLMRTLFLISGNSNLVVVWSSGAIFQEKLFEKIDIKHIILRSEKKGQYGIWFNNLTTTLEDP